MSRTVVVRVDSLRVHPKYRKSYKSSRKYKAHVNDAGAYQMGDVVRIQETRPLSKEKRWKVTDVVKRAASREVDAEDDLKESLDPTS